MTRPTPIAIAGLGKIARDEHLPSIGRSEAFELAAIISRNASLAECPSYSDLGSFLNAEPDISAISLCMPPQARFEYARLALQAGRDVMLEKPPGASLAEVHALVALAEARSCVLYATWHSRHAACVPAARSWLTGKEIRSVTITWHEDVRYWHPGQDWVWEAGGLGVFDPGINALSVVTEILPGSFHLAEAELTFPENRDTPIAARLQLQGTEGWQGEADFDWRRTGDPAWDIAVDTDGGRLTLKNGGANGFVDDTPLSPVANGETEYDGVYQRFAALLAERRSEVDLRPQVLVSDSFMLGKRQVTDAFHW